MASDVDKALDTEAEAVTPLLKSRQVHFVYIARCADGSLYTGSARDPRARIIAHNAGRGARYTCGRRPVRLVYVESRETLSAALKREYELKQWPRAKKQALVRAARSEKRKGVVSTGDSTT